jgi:hypothetical protein
MMSDGSHRSSSGPELAFAQSAFPQLHADDSDCQVSTIVDSRAKDAPMPVSINRADPTELECASDLGWSSYLSAQGIVGAIVALSFPIPAGHSHAYIVGFGDARNDPALTRSLLSCAEAIWERIGAASHRSFTTGEVMMAARRMAPSLSSDADQLGRARLGQMSGPAIAIQTQVKGVNVKGVFFKAAGAEPITPAERREIDKLIPLFVEHGTVKANLKLQSRQTAMLEAMFDRVSLPMLLMDADSRPMFANASAEALLQERKWLLRGPDGALGAANAATTRDLRAAVRRAATSLGGADGQDVVRIDSASGDWRLVQIVPPSFRDSDETSSTAMMIVLSPGRVDASPLLLQALGLLPSEQKFLGRFLRSSNIGDAASDCGISEETARTYLKRVRSKLGVSRQMELASLISGLSLPLTESELVAQG